MSRPIFLPIGPLRLPLFGVTLALGLLVAALVFLRYATTKGMPSARALDLVTWTAAAGLLGARLMYVLLNLEYYRQAPQLTILISRGGMSWFGGLVAGLLVVGLYAMRGGIPFRPLADAMAPAVALGYAVARLGCDLYGTPTTLPWGVWIDGMKRHPTQIYAALASFLIYLHLRARARSPHYPGELFFRYLLLYGLVRFGLEFLRGEPALPSIPLSTGQVVSILMLVAGAAALLRGGHERVPTDR